MDIHMFSDEENNKIYKYRSTLKLPEDKYSDTDVLKIIRSTQWLARIYIDQFKQISPEELLKKVELEYNKMQTRNHRKTPRES